MRCHVSNYLNLLWFCFLLSILSVQPLQPCADYCFCFCDTFSLLSFEDQTSKLKYILKEARFFLIKSNNHENVSLAKAKVRHLQHCILFEETFLFLVEALLCLTWCAWSLRRVFGPLCPSTRKNSMQLFALLEVFC